MDDTIKNILKETASNNVKDIVFDEEKIKWVITYINDLPSDEFNFFSDLLEYLEGWSDD